MKTNQPVPRVIDRSDLTGRRFGKVIVVSRTAKRNKYNCVIWECLCDCGKRFESTRTEIKRASSCTCAFGKHFIRHGLSGTPEYVIWKGIRARCFNPKHRGYQNYGGRGILMSANWNDFSQFLKDVGLRPSPKHTLDCINNDGNYEPGNCKWATKREQAGNTRRSKLITYNGVTKCVAEWARTTGVLQGTLLVRINSGWTPPKLFTLPCHPKR